MSGAFTPNILIAQEIKKKTDYLSIVGFWRRHPDSNWGWSFCRALPYHLAMSPYGPCTDCTRPFFGAGDEARTRYLHLGKVALYQMSYTCISRCVNALFYVVLPERILPWGDSPGMPGIPGEWCLRPESNQRHGDFQSPALPTELQRQMATRKGLEPSTSGVTGRRSNQLNYRAIWCWASYPWWEQQGSNL